MGRDGSGENGGQDEEMRTLRLLREAGQGRRRVEGRCEYEDRKGSCSNNSGFDATRGGSDGDRSSESQTLRLGPGWIAVWRPELGGAGGEAS